MFPRREVALAVAAAVASSVAVFQLAPPGGDLAAHVYQRALFLEHGLELWNNFWYAGRYAFVTYSLLYYPLAAVLGIELLAVATIALAAGAFALVCWRQFGPGAALSSRTFAVAWSGIVVSGAFPFALGVALAVPALAAAQRGARRRFGVLALLTLLASPVAFALLVVVLAGASVGRLHGWRERLPFAAWLGALAAGELLLLRLFPGQGRFPFSPPEFAAAALFCLLGLAVTWGVDRARPLTGIFGLYLLACTVSFALPSAVGENIARLRFAALPLAVLALSLRRWRPRPVALVLLALALSWNATPILGSVERSADDRGRDPAYWAAAAAFLHARLTPDYRVEVVDTASHWASYYLARRQIPLARGWYRQDDFPQNAVLYGALTPARYLAWLRRLAVRYVVLPDVELDYSARAEARLITGRDSPLRRVARVGHVTVYAVPGPRPLATGPGAATVERLGPAAVEIAVARGGRYRLAVRYSPYWRPSRGCVSRAPDGSVLLAVRAAGRVRVAIDVDPSRMLATLVDSSARRCAAG